MNAGDIVLLGLVSLWAAAALLGKRRPADLRRDLSDKQVAP